MARRPRGILLYAWDIYYFLGVNEWLTGSKDRNNFWNSFFTEIFKVILLLYFLLQKKVIVSPNSSEFSFNLQKKIFY